MFNLLRRRRGFSLIELLIVIAIILIIITIALPRLSRARMYSQETAAIAAIRTIHTAQVQYYSQFGKYAASLTELGPPTSGAAGPAAADMIGNDLARGLKSGYKFTANRNQGRDGINAGPGAFRSSGAPALFSGPTPVIPHNYR